MALWAVVFSFLDMVLGACGWNCVRLLSNHFSWMGLGGWVFYFLFLPFGSGWVWYGLVWYGQNGILICIITSLRYCYLWEVSFIVSLFTSCFSIELGLLIIC
ncbi:hypothetical protein P167DRAFT_608278 [Morchella conica CCBAS932]|uniref:Uncharacterized protein n=1 Tax=Morchella conica CCBAS932 TaxID=1392247 RepID=A0A3N4KI33_9PEZI|nr:hypothetical protein P167DRAFT_608278 [Morchella conica CCBAS932]